MKEIALTQDKHAIVDDGDFEWLDQWNWYFNKGYAARKPSRNGGKRGMIYMHRIINKTPDGIDTDHRNLDRLDNRRANLRNVTKSQNQMNKSKGLGCSSRFKGVCWDKRTSKWMANIRRDGKQANLGRFICEIVAAAKYDEEAEKYFGEYARTNF